MDSPRPDDDLIRERAYRLWEAEGCPDGSADRHWQEAEAALLQDGNPDASDLRGAPATAAPEAAIEAPGVAGRSRRRG